MLKKLAVFKLIKYLTVSSVVVGGSVYTYNHFNSSSVVSHPGKQVIITAPKAPEQPKVFQSYSISDVAFVDESLDSSRIILIAGPIRDLSLQSNQLRNMAEQSDKPIYIAIDSPGGSVMGGTEFITAMKSVKAPVYTICMNLCASMAFIIHQYGTQRWVTDHSILMSHPASIGGGMGGELDKVVSGLRVIQRYVEKHNVYIAKRVKMDYQEFKAHSSIEMWLMSDEALAKGFADKAVHVSYQKQPIQVGPEEMEMYNRLNTLYNVK